MNTDERGSLSSESETLLTNAVFRAAYTQVIWVLLNLLLPDDGTTVRLTAAAAVGFWPAVVVLILMRRSKWEKSDCQLVVYGFWPCLVAAFIASALLAA